MNFKLPYEAAGLLDAFLCQIILKEAIFLQNETNLGLNNYKKQIKLKIFFKKSFKSCKISNFNFCFLGSVILHKLSTTASPDQHNFGLKRHRNINNISYESSIHIHSQ